MKIAVMGYGTVGSGVVKTLKMNSESISEKSKHGKIEVKYILDIKEVTDENAGIVTKNFEDIVSDDEVKVVVETMGGIHPAFEYVSRCLEAGKSVVTSNKELIAWKGFELMKIAYENGALLEFEASVGGGIPVIRAISDCLNSNEIISVMGIVNGTTNYILTKMMDEGESYENALKTAQELGYAERDPSADVKGLDAGRKLCILSALAFGKHITPDLIFVQGIDEISLEDIKAAEKLGYTVRLIARVQYSGGKLNPAVYPALIPAGSLFASVKGVNNAIVIKGNAVGEVMLSGPGAGMMPTASAVVSDVIDCCNRYGKGGRLYWDSEIDTGDLLDMCDAKAKFFVRTDASAAEVKKVFGDAVTVTEGDETAFITEIDTEVEHFKKLSLLDGVKCVIRVLDN